MPVVQNIEYSFKPEMSKSNVRIKLFYIKKFHFSHPGPALIRIFQVFLLNRRVSIDVLTLFLSLNP